jgi:gamma-glutamylcysteine synthetase
MSDLRTAAQQALEALEQVNSSLHLLDCYRAFDAEVAALKTALKQPERTLTDEVIADLWHKNGGFHHHFARAVERWLKGKNHA